MTFATEIAKTVPEVTTLIRIRPRSRPSGWTVNGTYSNVYQLSWPVEKKPVGVYDQAFDSDDEEDSLADCAGNDASWYYDSSAEILYFNPAGSTVPNDRVVVVEWDYFFASRALNWYRNPRDSGSADQHWTGAIIKPPVPTQGAEDLLFGFNPINVSNLDLAIAGEDIIADLHSWSLYKAQVQVWECAGDLATGNVSEIFTGVAGDYRLSSGVLTIQVNDPLLLLEQTFDLEEFDPLDFPGMNFDETSRLIRKVYGWVDFMLGTNIDYDATPATNVNRNWVLCKGAMADAATLNTLVQHLSASNTATTTEVADADGFNPGDCIEILDNSVAKQATVSSVNYGTNIITHSSIGARSPVITDTVKRGFVRAINVYSGDSLVASLKYGLDWTESDFANDTRGVTLADNFEAAYAGFGGNPFDPGSQVLRFGVYGDATLPKKLDGVTDFGQVSQKTGAYSSPVIILWDLLRNQIRKFRETVTLDETAWNALAVAFDRPGGIVVPQNVDGTAPTFKELVQLLLQTEILKMHFKVSSGENLLTITQTAPLDDNGAEATDREMAAPDYAWSYKNTVYRVRSILYAADGGGIGLDSFESNVAKYLHRVDQVLDIDTIFPRANPEGNTLAQRLTYLLSERRGTLRTVLPVAFTEKSIDDELMVGSERLPGFALSGSMNERSYAILSHAKSAQGVSVTLDDQKGVEDNAGSW